MKQRISKRLINTGAARRGFSSFRWGLILSGGLLLVVLLAYPATFLFYPEFFLKRVPGSNLLVRTMLQSDVAPLRQRALRVETWYRQTADPEYFDSFLSICATRGHDEAALAIPALVDCAENYDLSIRQEKMQDAWQKIRPIQRKYADDPNFIFWSADLILEAGDAADKQQLEDTFNAVVKKKTAHSYSALPLATWTLKNRETKTCGEVFKFIHKKGRQKSMNR
jgi:hypothetical protein